MLLMIYIDETSCTVIIQK